MKIKKGEVTFISIHAPRGGSDAAITMEQLSRDISIHAPRGGSDFWPLPRRAWAKKFQSTLPVGGATGKRSIKSTSGQFQSTLPVGGATPDGRLHTSGISISIHAPRGGSDRRYSAPRSSAADFNPRSPWGERLPHSFPYVKGVYFNPRSPWGERRDIHGCTGLGQAISIHAPRGGSDFYLL